MNAEGVAGVGRDLAVPRVTLHLGRVDRVVWGGGGCTAGAGAGGWEGTRQGGESVGTQTGGWALASCVADAAWTLGPGRGCRLAGSGALTESGICAINHPIFGNGKCFFLNVQYCKKEKKFLLKGLNQEFSLV